MAARKEPDPLLRAAKAWTAWDTAFHESTGLPRMTPTGTYQEAPKGARVRSSEVIRKGPKVAPPAKPPADAAPEPPSEGTRGSVPSQPPARFVELARQLRGGSDGLRRLERDTAS